MAYEQIIQKTEIAKCLLCHDAPCSMACKKNVNVSKILRSLRFENEIGARKLLKENTPCINCKSMECMESCNRKKLGESVHIKKVLSNLCHTKQARSTESKESIDLSIEFCGVRCENPFFLSSSIVGSNYDMVAKAFDLGWAGVAFKTIGTFIPEETSPRFDRLEKEGNPFIGFKNIEQISDHSLEENIGYLKKLKKNYPTKVIIASIMGQNEQEWTYLASKMEEAGADIIECNFSCPHMSGEGLGSDIGTNPTLVERYTRATKRGTKLPVLAKMTPNITNMEIPAMSAVKAGADGLAAINTIKSIMNVDLHTFASAPNVVGKSAIGGYSGKAVKPIALRFIHDMRSNKDLRNIPISGMGGIENWKDAAEFIALGCETVQVTTAVMQYGYRIIEDIIEGMSNYLEEAGFTSIKQLVGKALENIVSPEELDRKSICYPKFDRKSCVGCGRCYISCYDGGHQALRMGADHKPIMDAKKCVGCHLCKVVCEVGAITSGPRVMIKEQATEFAV